MVRALPMALLILTGFLLSSVKGEFKADECENGTEQSPININTSQAVPNLVLGGLNMSYSPANAALINDGHAVQVAWSGDAGSLQIEGVNYRLKQCHWHLPAEHTIDNEHFPLELHMVHQTDDEGPKIAVIGIIYDFNEESDYFLETLTDAIDESSDNPEQDLGSVDPSDIGVESDEQYYRYNGSLTTEPYTEGVIWTVIKQVRTVKKDQVDGLFKALNYTNNSREVQPLCGRTVELYDPDDTSSGVGHNILKPNEEKTIPLYEV